MLLAASTLPLGGIPTTPAGVARKFLAPLLGRLLLHKEVPAHYHTTYLLSILLSYAIFIVDSQKQELNSEDKFMDPHPLANLFKLVACCKPIAKNEEVIKEKVIGLHLLNEKHGCNDISMNPIGLC